MGEENRITTYEISVEELILFARRYNYTKKDIEELTVREKYEMLNSNLSTYVRELEYYEDMSKFAKLAAWILNSFGAEIDSLEDLIGEIPCINDNIERKMNDNDLELIEKAKELGLNYKITSKGVKFML